MIAIQCFRMATCLSLPSLVIRNSRAVNRTVGMEGLCPCFFEGKEGEEEGLMMAAPSFPAVTFNITAKYNGSDCQSIPYTGSCC